MSQEFTAVIPTYNSAELVFERVNELFKAQVEKIIFCDDASSDDTARLLKDTYGDRITVIQGDQNIGPGGNRNRCIPFVDDGEILLFLDADCELIVSPSELMTAMADNFSHQENGVVGFSIQNKDGQPMSWNYGDLMHPVHEAADQKLDEMLKQGVITPEQFILGAPARASSYRMIPEVEPKEVGWVAEGCFAVRSSLYRKLGGFAFNMRYHETHDFNARVKEAGYKTIFCPLTVARHLEYDSRFERRTEDERQGRLYYYQKHWGMSEEVFKRLFDE